MVQKINQSSSERLTIRFKFKKLGKLQYISHLDLVRTMHKIIVRAKLPLWYSEGFNPKPKMVFAAPLSIGTESVSEYMDIRLSEYIDPIEAMRRLNENMTEEMQICEAYYPKTKFTDMKWITYTISIKAQGLAQPLSEKCSDALSAEKIEVAKKGSDAVIDIRSQIKSASVTLDGDLIRISCVLSADPSSFLNPEYIVKYLKSEVKILSSPNLTEEYYTIMREAAHFEDMSFFK